MSTTAASVNQPATTASRASLALLCVCFLLSGFAALVYQTAWTRQFALVFGTSELAVATVLAAYMAGLAAGAWLAERYLPRLTRPVMTYALLELGIAVSAVVAVPALLRFANVGLVAMFGGQPEPPGSDHVGTSLFFLVSSFIALALPTTLMGATLPILARHAVAEERQIGSRIGALYAVNTCGAVAGALVTAFVLLPDFGLSSTLWFAAACNGFVFLLAVALARRTPSAATPRGYTLDAPALDLRPPPLIRHHSFNKLPGPAWVLPLVLLSGAVAFFLEVLWTRMFTHVLGSSIHAFGVMVASFLTGIALGGALGAAVARTRAAAAAALAIALLAAAIASLGAYLLLGRLVPDAAGLLQANEIAGVTVPNALLAGMLLLPMTIALGTTYPLAVRVLAAGTEDAAAASARVLAWNTGGAIVGALAAGFWLIPMLKFEGSVGAAGAACALLSIGALWLLQRPRVVVAAIFTVLAVATLLAAPRMPTPDRLLVTSPLNVGTGRVLSYAVGRSASVVMLAKDGGLELRTNGLPEALMDGTGSLPRFSGEYWLSPLAVLARPTTRDMLVVGFGGGVTLEAVPPSVAHVDVVELEPEVIAANRATAPLRRRDPLADPRVNVILNDARGALQLTNKRYDAIVSQPSHPWTAGASHLYTREFIRLAHEHLNPQGVFVQWMNVAFMDEDLLRSLTATLLDVFPELRVYRPDVNTVLFLASDAPLDPETRLAITGEPLRAAALHYARYGINNAEDLVTALVLDTPGARQLAAGSPLITDDDNRLATSEVFERRRGLTADGGGRVFGAQDPLQRPESFVFTALRDTLSFPYIARRIGAFAAQDPSMIDRLRHMAAALDTGADAAYARAYFYRLQRDQRRAEETLKLEIGEYPADGALRADFLRPWMGQLIRADAPTDVAELAASADARSKFMVEMTRHALASEWPTIAQADDALAEIAWTDAWYPEAVELRVNWRTRVTDPAQKKRFAEEAIWMIDRSSLLNPTLALYGFRTRAGFGAARPEVVLESVSAYAQLAGNLVKYRARPADTLRQDQAALTTIVDDAAKLPGADPARIAEVRAQLAALAAIP